MRNTTESLSDQIEHLVREHIEASRRAAAAAVERAFGSNPIRLRATTEVVALGERLYEAVRAQPGETMAVLAPELGKTPRELHRPMMVLKRAGRVRAVGQRHQTRYFPAVVRSA